MDFRLAEDQRALQDAARRFARGELETLARKQKARHEAVPDDCLWRYAEMDFLDISVATQYSDLGPGNLEALIVIEEFAQVSATVAFLVFESSAGPVRAIEHFAPESLRQRVIPRVCRGELAVAVAMSEPDAGSALTDLRTTARADGDSVLVRQRTESLVLRRQAFRRPRGLRAPVGCPPVPRASAQSTSRKPWPE
ncbi:acyl-CoA dehydrogenase family protein [Solimonas sp. SE-A11]|uniref:acyl-CoA dehydrogenase family protein n=1 Tax=Solimonas sp. SE-A11 TaxID=3054954 RepID=UPI00259C81E1|nr:acyl-CoA dehydrogenase family protein [Solimonas sp. SE-A11]MDM4771509.1 acyl-CoA dehydrogenase family protein [Solimonas sp. SE-A11]